MKNDEQPFMAVCWAMPRIKMEFFSAIWVGLKDTNWKEPFFGSGSFGVSETTVKISEFPKNEQTNK